MRIHERTLDRLATMICGDRPNPDTPVPFPYRSSSRLTAFFKSCEVDRTHDGTTRKYWVLEVLKALNMDPSTVPDLPSDSLIRVISELMDESYFFDQKGEDRDAALGELNGALKRDSLVAYSDPTGRCHLRSTGTGANSALLPHRPRPLSKDEVEQRERLAKFLDSASEDEFTEKVVIPLFQRLGFHRVTATGHKEKALEFGKDLWMKFQLPTGHWLYFCAQIKKDKIDAKGVTGGTNVAEILNQAKMAMGNALFDPDANRKVLLDHIFLISAGEITRQARAWLVERLDQEQRRHVIFMDRDEFLDHAARILTDLRVEQSADTPDFDLPF